MKLNLTATDTAQERIKAYLEQNASESLSAKINNGVAVYKDGQRLISRKTLKGFMAYATAKALKDEEEKKALCAKFAEIATKYLPLQGTNQYAYVAVIAKSPFELRKEGEALHHCVGKMGYDQKFVREQTLIFFIRSTENPEIPLATVEYSVKNRSVLQCYADHNQKPDQAVMDYVNNVWLPHANKAIKKIAA